MLPLFIVEDVLAQRERIEKAIKDYITIEDMDINVVVATANPYECLEYLEKKPNVRGLYFLDVDLKMDMDGLELGKRIRELDPNGRIVIVTTKGAMAFFTFVHKLEVLDYIVKESTSEVISRIRACLKIAYDRYMQWEAAKERELEITIGNRKRKIPLDEVCFIETCFEEHRLALHTTTGKMEFRGYMKEIEVNNPSLTRVHRAYLVNLDNARAFNEEKRLLEMINGGACYVSTRKLSQVKKALDPNERL